MGSTIQTKEPLVSVAMATYNGARFIKEQIESILRQTISNIEIVVCDDCSTDETWTILQNYATKDNRFRIYQNETNLGFVKNFEKALSLCSGEYIALSDQDDIWMDNHIELLLSGLGEKIMSCGNALLVDGEGRSLNTTWKEYEQLDYVPEDDFLKLKSIILFRNPYQGASMLFRKELLNYAIPFPSFVSFHDRWLAIVACLSGGIAYIDKVLLYYRRASQNVTSNRKKEDRWFSFFHGWTKGKPEEVDALLNNPSFPIIDSEKHEMLRWRYVIKKMNSERWKPIARLYLLKEFKPIYSFCV